MFARNGNNQIMEEKLMMEKTNCNFRRMESSSNVVGKRTELESTDASGLVS